ncbi:MAG: hypothetical protein INF98_18395 [Roseomonas sp.]|nr:hypothetical protein [Roseomonas sp.]
MPTNPTPIVALPTAPSRADPANFPARADAFLGALAAFGTQTNDLGAITFGNAVEAAQSATAAAASFSGALAAGTGITGTSTSSVAIGTGSKSFTIETGRAFVAGMPVRIGQAGANANINFMDASVTSYDAGTGALVVNVTAVGGSGTFSAWAVRALSRSDVQTTYTATQTFSGDATQLAMVLADAAEVCTLSATGATGTINYDIATQSVLFSTANATANWTMNLRLSSTTTLNAALAIGQAVTVVFMATQGTTAFRNTTVQVDGATAGVTTRWQGGAAPTAGNASGVDAYSYTVIKTAAATFTVLASLTRFA